MDLGHVRPQDGEQFCHQSSDCAAHSEPDSWLLRNAILFGISSLLLFLWWQSERIQRSRDILFRIPGPPCFPVLGSVLSMGSEPHKALTLFRKRYGDVYRIQIGSVPVVVLNGVDVIRTALIGQKDVWSGRPDLLTFRLASEGKSMAFNSYSPEWRIHRRLAEKALRIVENEAGFVDGVIVGEAKLLAESLANHDGASFDPTSEITWSVARVMYSLCYGDSRRVDDCDFRSMVENTLHLIRCHQLGNAWNFFPLFRIFFIPMHWRLLNVCDRMLQTTRRKEREHLATYREGRIRDAMDALIRLTRRCCPLPMDQVLHTVQEFIGAGLDIVYISLTWAVLFLARYPDARRRLTEEVHSVIGLDRSPTGNDVKTLVYTQAFVMETLRYSCVIPMALPHCTLDDTVISGYQIPANTMVLLNLCSIQRDPDLWPEPDCFRPERFIDDVTGSLNRSAVDNFGGFGFGRRRCVGEQLAKKQMVLYLAVIVQRCVFIQTQTDPSEVGQSGIVLRPRPFHIRIKRRC